MPKIRKSGRSTKIKSFEDKFDHDPDEIPEEDDLDPNERRTWYPQKHEVPKSGCFGGLFKMGVSLSLIALTYLYIFEPAKFADLQDKAMELQERIKKIAAMDQDGQAPSLAMKKKVQPVTVSVRPPAPAAEQRREERIDDSAIVLFGSGSLPDFTTAAKKNPSLNGYTDDANKMTFGMLDSYHALVKRMISEWAEETDEQKIAEIVQMPYKSFFNRTSAVLLSQTILKQVGLTPEKSDRLISQSPIQAMALLYPKMREAMAAKTTVQDQIRVIEPVSSFLIYICHDEPECMASWDLLIDMLGAKQFAPRLEKAPETIYAEQ